MLNGNAVIQAERSAGIPLTPEMKQFVQANNQGGVTFDGMKAWRAKFADAEQKYKRSGEANAARRAGEMRRAITDDMRTMAENGGFFDDWQKLMICLKRDYPHKRVQSLFLGVIWQQMH